jgi:GNAT superfamily N-acetyltransferase
VTPAVLPGQETLLACWTALARLSPGARIHHDPAAAAAVFPSWTPLNNAIVLGGPGLTAANRVASVYREAGVDLWALWLPSRVTDLDAPDRVGEIGALKRDTTTLVMRATLPAGLRHDGRVVRTSIATATRAGDEPVPVADLGEPDRVPGLNAWALVHDGQAVAAAWTFVHRSDCGIYAAGTVPAMRRRGFARALGEHALADAWRAGARTASLQSTRMGRPLYESLAFEAVGRYEEWVSVPSPTRSPERHPSRRSRRPPSTGEPMAARDVVSQGGPT